MTKEVGAFLRCEVIEEFAYRIPKGVDAALGGLRSNVLSFENMSSMGFKSGLLGRQKHQGRAGSLDCGLDRFAFVAAEIIEDDDVPWPESRTRTLTT